MPYEEENTCMAQPFLQTKPQTLNPCAALISLNPKS